MTDLKDVDRCQHPRGCAEPYFTFCPRCHLFVCIQHLNMHHNTAQNDINQTVNDIANYSLTIEQKINTIKEQQARVNRFYEHEIQQLMKHHETTQRIYKNLSSKGSCYSFTDGYQKSLQLYQSIKQEDPDEQRPYQRVLLTKMHHLLQESLVSNVENEINVNSTAPVKSDIDIAEQYANRATMIIEPLLDDSDDSEHSNQTTADSSKDVCASSSNTEQIVSEDDSKSRSKTGGSLKWKSFRKLNRSACPLTNASAFGLSMDYHIPNIPCRFHTKNTSLTYSQYLKHLMAYHRLKQKAALLIADTLLSKSKKRNFDVISIDLFSKWKKNDIFAQPLTLRVHPCPLVEGNVYGLPSEHDTIPCNNTSPVRLYNHLRLHHNFRATTARRLILALIDNEPVTKRIFQPNDIIFDNSTNRKRPRKPTMT